MSQYREEFLKEFPDFHDGAEEVYEEVFLTHCDVCEVVNRIGPGTGTDYEVHQKLRSWVEEGTQPRNKINLVEHDFNGELVGCHYCGCWNPRKLCCHAIAVWLHHCIE
jgi:hypothetical protein